MKPHVSPCLLTNRCSKSEGHPPSALFAMLLQRLEKNACAVPAAVEFFRMGMPLLDTEKEMSLYSTSFLR